MWGRTTVRELSLVIQWPKSGKCSPGPDRVVMAKCKEKILQIW